MKLTAKIVGIFMLGITLLTVLLANLLIMRDRQRLMSDVEEQATALGTEVRETAVLVWQSEGEQGVLRHIQQVDNRHEQTTIRWMSISQLTVGPTHGVPVAQLQQAERGAIFFASSHDEQGRQVHKVFYPVEMGSVRKGWLEISEPVDDVHQHTRGTLYYVAGTFGAMLACALLVTLLGIRTVGRPLERLIAKTERIGEGEFSPPVTVNGRDEIAQLGTALNAMCDKLQRQRNQIEEESKARIDAVEQLRHADRLQTVGRLASGVAHELGTPLNVVSGRAQLIAAGQLDDAQVRESATAIKTEADRMAGIIRQLLDFARRREPQVSSVDLRDVAARAVELLRPLAQKHDVSLILDGQQPVTAEVDAAQMQQVVTNLVVNAVQASPSGGKVHVGLDAVAATRPSSQSMDDGAAQPIQCIRITVQDQGPGIPAEDLPHLFEPFFTTKDTGEGTGLGLSVSHGIVEDHRGWIEVYSAPEQGSKFEVYLPNS